MKEDKEEVLTGEQKSQRGSSITNNADVVCDENIPTILIDTTPRQEEQ